MRQHFNLGQGELAQWLGLSEAAVSHLETGRRGLSPAAAEALAPLVAHLPAPSAARPSGRYGWPRRPRPPWPWPRPKPRPAGPPRLLPAPRPPPAPRVAAFRRESGRGGPLGGGLARAGGGAAPHPGPTHEPVATSSAWQSWFRHRWLARRPVALAPPLSARYHLLRLQAEAFDAEAAALWRYCRPAWRINSKI